MTFQALSITHTARKRFGQNFLNNPHYIEKMLSAISPGEGESIIEIGPGLGALTAPLLNAGSRLATIEIDRDLAAALQENFSGSSNFSLVNQDALKVDFTTLVAPGTQTRVVGNLPYNISTPLIFHLLKQSSCISEMYFLLQREVVDRLAAAPGSKSYGKLGIMAQYQCDVTPLFDIPPEAFTPQPKVVSSYVKLCPRPYPQQAENIELLGKVVSTAFQQRRKTLRNALKTLMMPDQFDSLGIDPSQRPETLSINDYILITNALAADAKLNEAQS